MGIRKAQEFQSWLRFIVSGAGCAVRHVPPRRSRKAHDTILSGTNAFRGFLSLVCTQMLAASCTAAEPVERGDTHMHVFQKAAEAMQQWERRYSPTHPHFRLIDRAWETDFSPAPKWPSLRTGGYRSKFTLERDFMLRLRRALDEISTPDAGHGAGILLRLAFFEDRESITLAHVKLSNGAWAVCRFTSRKLIP